MGKKKENKVPCVVCGNDISSFFGLFNFRRNIYNLSSYRNNNRYVFYYHDCKKKGLINTNFFLPFFLVELK